MFRFHFSFLLASMIPFASFIASGASGSGDQFELDQKLVARGRYVAKTTGCNDCHTPGYNEANGNVPENVWLIGTKVGYKGPWGTSYPVNLRHALNSVSEKQWVSYAKTFKSLPPMPWYNVNAMTTLDLRALYHFVRSLGDDDTQIPAPLRPGVVPTTPYLNFEVIVP